MQKFTEFLNEGFFENSYLRYKNKVAQILTSLGIVIDNSMIKRVEEWIRDFYLDKMDAFDCARSIRDNISRICSVTESIEQFAADIINSCPEHSRRSAVKLINGADRLQKERFDRISNRISDILDIDLRTIISSYGYEILELICGRKHTDEEIVDTYASIGTRLAKKEMDIEEAMRIIEDAGIVVSPASFIKDLYSALVKEFRNAEVDNTVSFDENSKKIYIAADDDPWLVISYIESADKVYLENLQKKNEYSEYYPKLQGGAEGIANRIRNRYGNQ